MCVLAQAAEAAVEMPVEKTSKLSGLGRRLSFSKKKKVPAADASGEGGDANGAPGLARDGSQGGAPKQSTITRVLSFGRKKKEPTVDEDGNVTPRERKTSVAGELVRKLSFGKKKPAAQ